MDGTNLAQYEHICESATNIGFLTTSCLPGCILEEAETRLGGADKLMKAMDAGRVIEKNGMYYIRKV